MCRVFLCRSLDENNEDEENGGNCGAAAGGDDNVEVVAEADAADTDGSAEAVVLVA